MNEDQDESVEEKRRMLKNQHSDLNFNSMDDKEIPKRIVNVIAKNKENNMTKNELYNNQK